MPAQLERVVVLVDARQGPEERGLVYRRYAETTDGQRIDDGRWGGGSFSGSFFDNRDLDAAARAAERRESTCQSIRERHKQADDHELGSLVSALREAGVPTTPAELRALPLAEEFTDAAETGSTAKQKNLRPASASPAADRRSSPRYSWQSA